MNERFYDSKAQAIRVAVAKVTEAIMRPFHPRTVIIDENGRVVKLERHKVPSELEDKWESVMYHTTGEE